MSVKSGEWGDVGEKKKRNHRDAIHCLSILDEINILERLGLSFPSGLVLQKQI
jgi:hypothetical protein